MCQQENKQLATGQFQPFLYNGQSRCQHGAFTLYGQSIHEEFEKWQTISIILFCTLKQEERTTGPQKRVTEAVEL